MRRLAAYMVVSLALPRGLLPQTSLPPSARPLVTEQIAVHYLAVAESASVDAQARSMWQARLDRSRDTIESVLRWNNAHQRSAASLRMLLALSSFWNGTSLVAAFNAALSTPVVEDSALQARAFNSAALAAFRVTDQSRARSWAHQSIALFMALHDSAGAGRAYQRLVQVALRDGDHAALRALADTGERLCTRDQNCQAYFVNMRGESARVRRQYDSAAAHYTRADSMYRRLSPAFRMDMAHNIGFTFLALGRTGEGRERFTAGLQNAIAMSNRTYIAFFIAGLASAESADRKAANAAKLFGLFDALLEQTGRVPDPADAVEYNRYRSRAREQLGAQAFDDSTRVGRTMRVDSFGRPDDPDGRM